MRSNIGIIISREFTTRVVKKSFIIMTLLGPIAMVLMVMIPFILGSINSEEVKKVVVIDRTNIYGSVLKDNDEFKFVLPENNKTLNDYKKEGEGSKVSAVLKIDENLIENPKAITLFSYKQMPKGLESYIKRSFDKYLTDEKVASYKEIPNLKQIIDDIDVNVDLATMKWSTDGAEVSTSSSLSSAIGMTLTMFSYFFIMMYGSMVLQGVLEEKKNKIMEIMVSTVRPFDMMMGKIIGIGLVGLFQMIIWFVFMFVIVLLLQLFVLGGVYDMSTLQSMDMSQVRGMMSMSADNMASLQYGVEVLSGINFFELIVMFILFFIGGYFLYSSMFAAIGSAVSSDEDTAQLMIPVTFCMIFAMYAGIASMDNPEGPLAMWCSFIPFTSPVVMMVRLPFDVPFWQEMLSVMILFVTFVVFTYISGKIYRVGILMYGKKPSIKEMIKWIRYK